MYKSGKFLVIILALFLISCNPWNQKDLSFREKSKLARNAMVFGTPLVMHNINRDAAIAHGIPINHMYHFDGISDHKNISMHTVNIDSLYSVAYLDLSDGPIILTVPNFFNEFYSIDIIDPWGNLISSIGTRTSGKEAANYMLVGPGWKGKKPKNVKIIELNTNEALVNGKVFIGNIHELKNMRTIQRKISLIPLSKWGMKYTPDSIEFRDIDFQSPSQTLSLMTAQEFYSKFNKSLIKNPVQSKDEKELKKYSKIYVGTGIDFDIKMMNNETQEAINQGFSQGKKMVENWELMELKNVGQWTYPKYNDDFDAHYLDRAIISVMGFGKNALDDLIYFILQVDEKNVILDGNNNYILNFKKSQLPEVNAFWTITLYDKKTRTPIHNPLKKCKISSEDGLWYNRDGSLTIYIQNSNPGEERHSNWMPSNEDEFYLILRAYWPKKKSVNAAKSLPKARLIGNEKDIGN